VQNEQDELEILLTKKGYEGIPFYRLPSGQLYINVVANGIHGRLILDTGASRTIIASSSTEKFNLQLTEHREFLHAGAGSGTNSDAEYVRMYTPVMRKLTLSENLTFNDIEIVVLGLYQVNNALERHGVEAIDGIMGANILITGRAVIDYASSTLFLKPFLPESLTCREGCETCEH
jgi:hypothetical protein